MGVLKTGYNLLSGNLLDLSFPKKDLDQARPRRRRRPTAGLGRPTAGLGAPQRT